MLIEEIKFRFGAGKESQPLTLNSPIVTIFVGPNGSGKSMVLRELSKFSKVGICEGSIIESIKFHEFSDGEVENIIEQCSYVENSILKYNYPEDIFVKFGNWHGQYNAGQFRYLMRDPQFDPNGFVTQYLSHYVLVLDGLSRIGLSSEQERGDLKDPQTTFARILTQNDRRQALRNTLFDAFGLYLGMDVSEGASIKLRYGDTAPPNERTLEDATLDWMRSARPTDQWSDGMKAFTGIMLELRVGDPKIVIIDEPEAFLHPPLAYKLGREIARTARQSDKQIFVSTHSSQFLMGAIQSGAEVNVVRLTYQQGGPTARVLANDDIRLMMQEPFLRSANALSGLFYDGVVVTEADADRAFYQELNERLLEEDCGRGIPNVLFLNANGKDSVNKIVGPLRSLGIPVAAILDIDALNPKTNFGIILEAINYPKTHEAIKLERTVVWSELISDNRNPKSEGGILLLRDTAKEKAENLLDRLDMYGLFVVRHGEVEHWLPNLDVPRSKRWLRNIFEALGSDPSSCEYVHSDDGDVWAFLDKISVWIKNKSRRGMLF